MYQGEVALLQPAFTDDSVQPPEFTASLRDQQATAGLAVEAVDELKIRCIRPQAAQYLDHSPLNPATGMHGKPRGLVQDQQALVFMENGAFELSRHLRWRSSAALVARRILFHRRDADSVTGRQSCSRTDAAAVDTHFTAA